MPGLLALIEGDLPSGRYAAGRARGGAGVSAALAFALPPALEAGAPPEERGLARDAVRLMVARGRRAARPRALPRPAARSCAPGDLLVVNESATMPAALRARARTAPRVELHLSTPEPARRARSAEAAHAGRVTAGWSSCAATARASAAPRAGERLALPGGGAAELGRAVPVRRRGCGSPSSTCPRRCSTTWPRTARRSATRTSPRDWPLRDHQTIFAARARAAPRCRAPAARSRRACCTRSPRAASASRRSCSTPASPRRSAASGPTPSATPSPPTAAARVNARTRRGGRVIAVGTTVTRALESAAAPDGAWCARRRLDRPHDHARARRARGRRAGHRLARARREPPAAARGGRAAARSSSAPTPPRRAGYRWHEFGDAHLLLPTRRPRARTGQHAPASQRTSPRRARRRESSDPARRARADPGARTCERRGLDRRAPG